MMKLGWRSFFMTLPIFAAGAAGFTAWWICVDHWRTRRRRKRLAGLAEKSEDAAEE